MSWNGRLISVGTDLDMGVTSEGMMLDVVDGRVHYPDGYIGCENDSFVEYERNNPWVKGVLVEFPNHSLMGFKVGDEVIVTKRLYGHRYNIGERVTITKIRDVNSDFDTTNGKDNWLLRVEEFEKAPVISSKFTAGQEVIITGNSNCHGLPINFVATVDEFLGHRTKGTETYELYKIGIWFVREYDMQAVQTPSTTTLVPKFKTGDKVKVVNNTCYHGFNIGEIIEISRFDSIKGEVIWYFAHTKGGSGWYIKESDCEEIKPKTFTDDFFEKFPNAPKNKVGAPKACLADVYAGHDKYCYKFPSCNDCWKQKFVEE